MATDNKEKDLLTMNLVQQQLRKLKSEGQGQVTLSDVYKSLGLNCNENDLVIKEFVEFEEEE